VVVALVSLVAVAAVVVAVIQSRVASAARRELETARADAASADQALRAATGDRDAQDQRARAATAELARANDSARQARRQVDELSMLLEAATGAEGRDDGDGLWRLLLANVTRRWAAVVGVPPDGRAIEDGPVDAQLHQALVREVERLREEVGVDVELSSVESGIRDAIDGDTATRITVLVAALELLGALASTAQRVTVEIADTLVLTGDGWLDPYGELAAAHERSVAAGAVLGPLDAADESVRLVLHHRPTVTAATTRR
jgi:hypothetical protein